jgi:CRISPR-associated protein Cas1
MRCFSLGYSLLVKDLTIACYAADFDPMVGFCHRPRFGRPALALDRMEPFRSLVVDWAVITAINTKMVPPREFVCAGGGVALTGERRKAFYRAYELHMDALVTHPIFGYPVSYCRMLELQVRMAWQSARWRDHEVSGIRHAVGATGEMMRIRRRRSRPVKCTSS